MDLIKMLSLLRPVHAKSSFLYQTKTKSLLCGSRSTANDIHVYFIMANIDTGPDNNRYTRVGI